MLVDNRRSLQVFEDAAYLIEASAAHLAETVKASIQAKGSCFIALSGGSTPKAIFERLTRQPLLNPTEWSKLHLFWSDERAVPSDHPDSNYKMAMDAGFSQMPIPPHHIHRMRAEEQIELHARAYEEEITRTLGKHPFDLIMLGMGDDGHTASLFPHTTALHSKRLIEANFVPQKNTWRMTMTFPCLHLTSHLMVYAMGASKQEMFKTILSPTPQIDEWPAQGIGTSTCPATWIVDRSIAQSWLAQSNS